MELGQRAAEWIAAAAGRVPMAIGVPVVTRAGRTTDVELLAYFAVADDAARFCVDTS